MTRLERFVFNHQEIADHITTSSDSTDFCLEFVGDEDCGLGFCLTVRGRDEFRKVITQIHTMGIGLLDAASIKREEPPGAIPAPAQTIEEAQCACSMLPLHPVSAHHVICEAREGGGAIPTPAPPSEISPSERQRLHALLQWCHAAIDPEANPRLCKMLYDELKACEGGQCVPGEAEREAASPARSRNELPE
jgi:hypothetical protein